MFNRTKHLIAWLHAWFAHFDVQVISQLNVPSSFCLSLSASFLQCPSEGCVVHSFVSAPFQAISCANTRSPQNQHPSPWILQCETNGYTIHRLFISLDPELHAEVGFHFHFAAISGSLNDFDCRGPRLRRGRRLAEWIAPPCCSRDDDDGSATVNANELSDVGLLLWSTIRTHRVEFALSLSFDTLNQIYLYLFWRLISIWSGDRCSVTVTFCLWWLGNRRFESWSIFAGISTWRGEIKKAQGHSHCIFWDGKWWKWIGEDEETDLTHHRKFNINESDWQSRWLGSPFGKGLSNYWEY